MAKPSFGKKMLFGKNNSKEKTGLKYFLVPPAKTSCMQNNMTEYSTVQYWPVEKSKNFSCQWAKDRVEVSVFHEHVV